MIRGVYRNDRGEEFVFGEGNVWQISGGNGISVNLETSQGFRQIGNTVLGLGVEGSTLTIEGAFSAVNNISGKQAMSRVFYAMSSGVLEINDEYAIDVTVKSTPEYSRSYTDSKFTMQLYAPNPFFRSKYEEVENIGGIIKKFRFPVNYSKPHSFGTTSPNKYKNIINTGTQITNMNVEFSARGECGNFVLTNLETFKTTTFTNAILQSGERLKMYRNSNGILTVTHFNIYNEPTDAIYLLDEDSELFDLQVGNNIIRGEALSGNENLIVNISYYIRSTIDV